MLAEIELLIRPNGDVVGPRLGEHPACDANPFGVAGSIELRDHARRPRDVLPAVFLAGGLAAGAAQGQVAGRDAVLSRLDLMGGAEVFEGVVESTELRQR